ncbi:MAG: amidohydrolase family protein [Eubacteriaceae bacterium]
MIDCHIHCGLGHEKNRWDGKGFDKAFEKSIKKTIEIYLEKGITGLRDGGNLLGTGGLIREISRETELIYRTPIRALYKKGGYGDFLGESISGDKERIIKMKKIKKESPDFFKIILTGIMSFTEFGVSGSIGFNKIELTEMINYAHDCGKKVMVHVNSPEGIMIAIESGADTIEHGYGIDDECLEALRETGTIWIPTIAPFGNIAKCGEDNPMKKYRDISKKYYLEHSQQVEKGNKQGVNIGLGSDSGATLVPHGQGTLDELKYLLACGLTEEKLGTIGKKVMEINE